MFMTSFTPPFGESSKISNSLRASDLAWLPPTLDSNCSERLWLHARTILVALENYSGWPGELNQNNQNLPDIHFPFLSFAHASAKTQSLQLPMNLAIPYG